MANLGQILMPGRHQGCWVFFFAIRSQWRAITTIIMTHQVVKLKGSRLICCHIKAYMRLPSQHQLQTQGHTNSWHCIMACLLVACCPGTAFPGCHHHPQVWDSQAQHHVWPLGEFADDVMRHQRKFCTIISWMKALPRTYHKCSYGRPLKKKVWYCLICNFINYWTGRNIIIFSLHTWKYSLTARWISSQKGHTLYDCPVCLTVCCGIACFYFLFSKSGLWVCLMNKHTWQ